MGLAVTLDLGHFMEGFHAGSEFGKFGWFVDPSGQKVELWEPPVVG